MIHKCSAGVFLPLLAFGLVLSSCMAQPPESATVLQDSGASRGSDVATVSTLNQDVSVSRQNAITRAVARVSPAVVGINVTEVREVHYRNPYMEDLYNDPFFQRFFESPRMQQEVHGLGSGFIISADGYIVTNDHVAGAASKVVVTTTDGKQFDARLVGSDHTSDVALLKIDATDLPYIELGNSDNAIVGEWVIALGNPFGLFDINSKPTVTVGVISNTNVNLSPQDERVYLGMLQTDAAISSGNSGGPLVNANGEVIGINSTIFSTSQSRMGAGSIGIGFAIPINRAQRVISELQKNGSVDRDYWTGLSLQAMNAKIARYLGLKSTEGVVIVDVVAGSPAADAGLRQGDVIVAINGERVKNEDVAARYLYDGRVGDILQIVYIRDNAEAKTTLNLKRRGTKQ